MLIPAAVLGCHGTLLICPLIIILLSHTPPAAAIEVKFPHQGFIPGLRNEKRARRGEGLWALFPPAARAFLASRRQACVGRFPYMARRTASVTNNTKHTCHVKYQQDTRSPYAHTDSEMTPLLPKTSNENRTFSRKKRKSEIIVASTPAREKQNNSVPPN